MTKTAFLIAAGVGFALWVHYRRTGKILPTSSDYYRNGGTCYREDYGGGESSHTVVDSALCDQAGV